MLAKIDGLCAERDGSRERGRLNEGARAWRPELVMREQLKWYDEKADNSPWIDALAELRQRATREGHASSTSRRSPLRSTSTPRRRWEPRLLPQQALRRGLAHMKRALMAASDAAVHYKPKKGAYRRRTVGRGFKP